MTSVGVLVLRNAMPSSVAITIDLLATANRMSQARSSPFVVRLLSVERDRRAPLGNGEMTVECSPATRQRFDIVIVPGLGRTTEIEIAAQLASREARAAIGFLTAQARRGARIATSCVGTFLLAEAGLLDGRTATTTWWLSALFRARYPQVKLGADQLVVVDGPFTTAGAAMAQMDLMLSIIALFAGRRLADNCARYLLLDDRRSQSRYMALGHLAAQDPQIARAEAWVRRRLGQNFSVDEVATAVGLSPRTFGRRVSRVMGLSPIRFIQRLRIEAAVSLLETTRHSVEHIAHSVGYAEASTLRRIMRRELKRSPAEVRV